MLACPYCRTPLAEDSPACPACHLDLERVKAVMGPTPRLSHLGVTDFAGCLAPPDEKLLERAVATFQSRFPQSHLAVVLKAFSPEFPLGTQLFWLFNTSGIARQAGKAGENRDVLIGVDVKSNAAGLTLGYGLEPFLGQKALDHLMGLAVPSFETGDYAAGVREIITGLTRLMEAVCRQLPDLLGLDREFAVEEKAGDY